MKKVLILFSIFAFFSCEKNEPVLGKDNDVNAETAKTNDNLSLRQSSIFPTVESMFIPIGHSTNCQNNILVFPDWDTYEQVITTLDKRVDEHCDAFENANPGLTDEEFEQIAEIRRFDEDKPLIDFENDLRFCSLRKYLFDMETTWLSLQGDNDWDMTSDPDNHFIDDDTERALLNKGSEVIIGTRLKGYIIYANQGLKYQIYECGSDFAKDMN